jgi:heterodisulfide reductase subunit A-like polyferredoxin
VWWLSLPADRKSTTEYGYGELKGVITQHELETVWAMGNQGISKYPITGFDFDDPMRGLAQRKAPLLSRICCQQAIKNALGSRSATHKPG